MYDGPIKNTEYYFPDFQLNSATDYVLHKLAHDNEFLTDLFSDIVDCTKFVNRSLFIKNSSYCIAGASLVAAWCCDNLIIPISMCGATIATEILSLFSQKKDEVDLLNFYENLVNSIKTHQKNTGNLNDKQIHFVTHSIHNELIESPYLSDSDVNSKLPIALEYEGLMFLVDVDSYITRAFEIAYNIFDVAYNGYEKDIKDLYEIIKMYSKDIYEYNEILPHDMKDIYNDYLKAIEYNLLNNVNCKKLNKKL